MGDMAGGMGGMGDMGGMMGGMGGMGGMMGGMGGDMGGMMSANIPDYKMVRFFDFSAKLVAPTDIAFNFGSKTPTVLTQILKTNIVTIMPHQIRH